MHTCSRAWAKVRFEITKFDRKTQRPEKFSIKPYSSNNIYLLAYILDYLFNNNTNEGIIYTKVLSSYLLRSASNTNIIYKYEDKI